MNDYKDILESIKRWAFEPYITCDVGKCGQCTKEQIRSEVSKEFLIKRIDPTVEDLNGIIKESQVRYRLTPLYIRVKGMMDSGMTLLEIEAKLRLEGIEI